MAEKNIGELPELTELDDLDQLVARSVGDVVTGRISIATLRAAMGSPDRIESASGDAFVEASKFNGSPRTIARSGVGQGYAIQATFSDGDKSSSELIVKGAGSPSAGIRAEFDEGAYTLSAHGAPLTVEGPIESNHAATKGYVDARPGADAWSKHAATQDVDLDGHKITGLGEPTEDDDAATKGYVDGAAPDRIKGGAGTTYEETEIGVGPDATGSTARLLRGVNRGDVFLEQIARENSGGSGHIGWKNTRSGYGRGYVEWSSSYVLIFGSHAAGNYGRVYVDGIAGGNVYFDIPGASAGGGYETSKGLRLGSHISHTPNVRALPSNVNSILHGIKLGVDAHDRRAELEWWDPTWTAIENVDSVSNVECSYTRTYRAAGGSLVTLEGTIEVTPDAAGQCAVQVDLPIARVGSGLLAGTAMAMEVTPPGHVVAAASVDSTTLTLGFDAEGVDPYLVGFRASYRAA